MCKDNITIEAFKYSRNISPMHEFTIELKPPIERMVICDEIDRTFGNGQLTFVYLMQRNKLEQEIKEQAGGKK